MEKEEALEILKDHQKYRRAEPPYDRIGAVSRHSPKRLGQAIDVAIMLLGENHGKED